jgi:hypothetical protein
MCLVLGYIYPSARTTIMADDLFCPSTTFRAIVGKEGREMMESLYSRAMAGERERERRRASE